MNTRTPEQPILGRFFQLGYITRDLEAGMTGFKERFGPVEFQVIQADPDQPTTRAIALGYLGPVMIEIIDPNPDNQSIYTDYIPTEAGTVRLHHTGHLIDDFDATVTRLEAAGYNVPFKLSYGTMLDCCYADTRAELGHYVEHVRLGEEGKQWFKSVPGFVAFP